MERKVVDSSSEHVPPRASPEDIDIPRAAAPRRHFVWTGLQLHSSAGPLTLYDIAKQFERIIKRFHLTKKLPFRQIFNDFEGSSHRCDEYRKEEIILAPIAALNTVLTSATPGLHETCFVCGAVTIPVVKPSIQENPDNLKDHYHDVVLLTLNLG